LHRALQQIEDVRPLFASFHWAYYAVSRLGGELDRERARLLRAMLEDTVRTLARSFRDLDFYQAWQELHHQPFCLDAALLLRVILWGLSLPSGFPVRWVAERIEQILVERNP